MSNCARLVKSGEFNKKAAPIEGRGQLCNALVLLKGLREQGFKSPTIIFNLVASNWLWVEAPTILHPSAICLLPSAFFTRTLNLLGALALGLVDGMNAVVTTNTGHGGESPAALVTLGVEPGISIDMLRQILNLSHPGTVRLIDRLEADGLVERRPGADGRFWLLAIASGIMQYALAFLLYLTVLQTTPVSHATFYIALIPVFGIASAILLMRIIWLQRSQKYID